AGAVARSDKVFRVYAQPFPVDVERHYGVGIRALRCEGERQTGGPVVASCSALVGVTAATPRCAVLLRQRVAAPETACTGRDYGRLAESLSAAVVALTRDVVNELPEK